MNNKPRVLLADDHNGLLLALRRLVEPGCEVVGLAETGAALIEQAQRLRPDVIVADLNLPVINGLEACRRLGQTMPDVRVVILTADDDAEIRERALTQGVSSFVLKYAAANQLVPAIQNAWRQAR